MLTSVRELARSLLSIIETRARLAANELEEQAVRLVEITLWFSLAILFLSVAGLTIPQLFLAVALLNVVVAGWIFCSVPEFVVRLRLWLLSAGGQPPASSS